MDDVITTVLGGVESWATQTMQGVSGQGAKGGSVDPGGDDPMEMYVKPCFLLVNHLHHGREEV